MDDPKKWQWVYGPGKTAVVSLVEDRGFITVEKCTLHSKTLDQIIKEAGFDQKPKTCQCMAKSDCSVCTERKKNLRTIIMRELDQARKDFPEEHQVSQMTEAPIQIPHDVEASKIKKEILIQVYRQLRWNGLNGFNATLDMDEEHFRIFFTPGFGTLQVVLGYNHESQHSDLPYGILPSITEFLGDDGKIRPEIKTLIKSKVTELLPHTDLTDVDLFDPKDKGNFGYMIQSFANPDKEDPSFEVLKAYVFIIKNISPQDVRECYETHSISINNLPPPPSIKVVR